MATKKTTPTTKKAATPKAAAPAATSPKTGSKSSSASLKGKGAGSQARRDESRKENSSGQKGEAGCRRGRPLRHSRGALADDFRGGLYHG
jgi:hypothetical protein